MIHNTRAVSQNINLVGIDISVFHYADAKTPSYNPITQRPILTTPTLTTPRAIKTNPTELEIQNSGGLIDNNTKKCVVDISSEAEIGDTVVLDGLTSAGLTDSVVQYRIVTTNIKNLKKDLFIKNQNEEEYNG